MATLLDPTVVTEAGVALVSEHGVRALSLRAVAGSLGVTPMALYRHVSDSEALSEAVMEAIVGRTARIGTSGDAREDLADWARHFHRDLMGFPGVAGWLLTHWFECGPMLERIDELLSCVAEHGLDGFEAVAVTNAVFTYVLMRCEAEREVRSKGVVERQLQVSNASRPLTRLAALAAHYTTAEFDAHFEFGLQALIAGMHLPAGARS
jgi:AcrR family transcriptional regulator